MERYRIGGGLQIIQNGYLVGPVRGPDAPRKPCCLDISAGLMEPDEGMKSTQVREGAEEVVRIKNGKIFLPDLVKNAGVVEQVTSTIAEAIEDGESPFHHGFDLEFFDSRIEVPTNTREVWIQGHSLHDWETGVTVEEDNSPSYELLNYVVENPPEAVNPIDTEVVEREDKENLWLNRLVYKFHPVTGEAELYKSGEKIFSGNFADMINTLEKTLGEDPSFTPKIRASLRGLPAEDRRIYEELDFHQDVQDFFQLQSYQQS